MDGTADWSTLWPASAVIWQLGNLVPLQVTLPGDYLAAAGIDPSAASFVLSLAPLAFASFTAIFAARSGVRASRADAWVTGVLTGTAVFASLVAVIALTSANSLAEAELWQAILLPSLVFALPLLVGAFVTEWREAGSGFLARARDRVEAAPRGWGDAPGHIVRGAAVVLAGLIGLGALVFAIALVLRGGEVIALIEASHVDVLGATIVTLAQLAYLPTLVIWGLAFVAGPGFAVGTGTAVSPAGTQLGVIPGIPVLGALPESTTQWLLLLALLPVALGALAGWIARSRLVAPPAATPETPAAIPAERSSLPAGWDAAPETARSTALTALLAEAEASRPTAGSDAIEGDGPVDAEVMAAHEPIGARFVIAIGIALLAAAGAALLAQLASGSIGPGSLSEVGPQPGPVALAVGVEVLVGAAILLLSPRRRPKTRISERDAATSDAQVAPAIPHPDRPTALAPTGADEPASEQSIEPTNETVTAATPSGEASDRPDTAAPRPRTDPDSTPTVDLGPRRPQPLPPVD